MKLGNRSKDITGEIFGSLTAICPHHLGKNSQMYWEYQCKCGTKHIARGSIIMHQAKMKNDSELPSCGCIELARKTKHGFRKAFDTHPTYRAYRSMMDRCYNINISTYKWYGGVGVTVCDAWKKHPEVFVKWAIENGWKPGLHIEKDILCDQLGIHPHIYSPKTCQWTSAKINVGYATNRNNYGKHPNIKLSHENVHEIRRLYISGEETNKSQIARDYGVTPGTIYTLFRK